MGLATSMKGLARAEKAFFGQFFVGVHCAEFFASEFGAGFESRRCFVDQTPKVLVSVALQDDQRAFIHLHSATNP